MIGGPHSTAVLLVACSTLSSLAAACRVDAAEAGELGCPGRASAALLSTDPAFSRAVARFVADRDFPREQDEPAWRSQMEPFVPTIIAALESPVSCVRAGAVELVLHGPRDDRILDSAIRQLRRAASTEDAVLWLRALTWQTKWWEPSPKAREVALEYLARPDTFKDGYPLATHVCRPEDAGKLGRIFLERGGLRNDWGPAFLKYLLDLGGRDLPDVMLTALAEATESQGPLADGVLRSFFPESRSQEQRRYETYRPADWGGPSGMLEFLTTRTGSALVHASDGVLTAVLSRAPENMEGGAATRARYWTTAACLFQDRREVKRFCFERLADAYGTEGLGELDRAIGFLSEAQALGTAQQRWTADRLADLQCRLAAQLDSGRISLVVSRLADGRTWAGSLSAEGDVLKAALLATPICLIDVEGDNGSTGSVPASWRVTGSSADRIEFRCDVSAELPHPTVQWRLRILFVPGSERFSGVVASDWTGTLRR